MISVPVERKKKWNNEIPPIDTNLYESVLHWYKTIQLNVCRTPFAYSKKKFVSIWHPFCMCESQFGVCFHSQSKWIFFFYFSVRSISTSYLSDLRLCWQSENDLDYFCFHVIVTFIIGSFLHDAFENGTFFILLLIHLILLYLAVCINMPASMTITTTTSNNKHTHTKKNK